MTEPERLLARIESGDLLRPSADTTNFVDFASAIDAYLNIEPSEQTPNARRLAASLGDAEHLILVLADGLGSEVLEDLPAGSFLRSHRVEDINAVYPPTTASALTSLATGMWPADHGITGWWTHIRELNAACAPLPFNSQPTSEAGPLPLVGVTPEQVYAVASRIAKQRDSLALLPERIVLSVYSNYFTGSGVQLSYQSLQDGVALLADRLATPGGPRFSYLYVPYVDEEGHRSGARHQRTFNAIQHLESQVEQLARRVAGHARIVVTSDHGMLDIPEANRHKLGPATGLLTMLSSPPSGDARVVYFHVRPGQEDAFRHRFSELFGQMFALLTTDEVEQLHLLGPGSLSVLTRERIGTFTAVALELAVLEYVPAGREPRILKLAAHHAGLTSQEMRIPFIVV